MKIAVALALGLLTAAAAPQDREQTAEAAYSAARAASPTPLRLDRDRQEWRLYRQSEGADVAETDQRWTERWAAAGARDSRVRALAVAGPTLSRDCVDIGISGCTTPTGGYLNIRGQVLMWQLQEGFTPEDGKTAGYVLLTGTDRLRAEAWGHEGVWYEAPKILWIEDQAYVGVAGVMAGTGVFNADALFRFTPDAPRPLTEIDNFSWRDTDLPGLLPTGLEIWKGVSFNYDTLTARTALWRPADGNCCPSGGEATLVFEIRDDRLVLTQLLRDGAE
ncbi:MAG: hypothetical protein EON88_36010 [Brevundimonas sp.]|nr:MAG: hypothetical protein EON88_36010 [Brevundimonas sp.]